MAAAAKDSALDRWRVERRLSYPDLAELLGCDTSSAWRYCLPISHARFRVPPSDVMARILIITERKVLPNDFYAMTADRAGDRIDDQTPALRQAGG